MQNSRPIWWTEFKLNEFALKRFFHLFWYGFFLFVSKYWFQYLLWKNWSLTELYTSVIPLNFLCVSCVSVYEYACLICVCLYAQQNNNLIQGVVPSTITVLGCFIKIWEFQGSHYFNELVFIEATFRFFCKWRQDNHIDNSDS